MGDDLKDRLRANALDECDEAIDRIEELEAKLRQTFGDMEQIYRRWKNGVRYDVLAREQGVTRERMRHRLLRYEDDKVRRLEAERDAAYKRGMEDAAKIVHESWHDGFPIAEIPRIIRAKIQDRKDD